MYQICFRDALLVTVADRIVFYNFSQERIALEASFLVMTALHHDTRFDVVIYYM